MAQSFNPGFDVATRSALQVAPEPVLTTGIGVATRWAIIGRTPLSGRIFCYAQPRAESLGFVLLPLRGGDPNCTGTTGGGHQTTSRRKKNLTQSRKGQTGQNLQELNKEREKRHTSVLRNPGSRHVLVSTFAS